MRWISRKEFWEEFESGDSIARLEPDVWCYFEISEEDLKEKIGDLVATQDLRGEDDPPEPVSRWYGAIDETPFILDFHHSHPCGSVVTIRHGDGPESRRKIRNEFKTWGDNWDESKAS